MANFGRVKTWGNETLQAADLNAEFDNVINNVTSGSVSSANIDLTDGYAWTGAHTFSVDMKVLNGAGVIVGNAAQVTTSSAGEFQVLGTAAADSTAIIGHWAAAATGGKVSFVKSRNATIGSSTIVADNDVLGTIEFMADDGSDFATPAASIFSRVNGTPGADDMPGELVLAVTADEGNAVTERVRILQNGTVELNSATLSFDGAASIDTSGNAILSLSAGTADIQVTASNLTPASNDGSALGVSGTAWSDLFLASGSVVNWVAGDITLTHSAGKLTFGGDGAVELDFNHHEMTNIDVNSGAIDGAIIGAASAAAGSFAAIVGTSLDINGAADISGDLTLSAGADGALTFSNAGENSIKIPDNQASALIVEEANAAYLTFVTTNSGEKVTISQNLDFDSGTIDLSTQTVDVTLNDAVDSLNFDSNTLSIDASNNRIGIGTAAPGGVLDIAKPSAVGVPQLSTRGNLSVRVHKRVVSLSDQTDNTAITLATFVDLAADRRGMFKITYLAQSSASTSGATAVAGVAVGVFDTDNSANINLGTVDNSIQSESEAGSTTLSVTCTAGGGGDDIIIAIHGNSAYDHVWDYICEVETICGGPNGASDTIPTYAA